MPPAVEVENLVVEIATPRGPIRAVDGVSLVVGSGDSLGIVGESGCGKTTTLRAVMGLLPRHARVMSGRIVVDGKDITRMSERQRRGVRGRVLGMVFQDPMTALNPVMPIGRQIAEAPRTILGFSRSKAHQRAIELLKQVGIPDPERRARGYAHELSGGLRQRVMIAIALACRPRILLCDEPTTALDVTIQDQILKLLTALRREEGLGLVYVSHDLAVVSQVCDRAAVMYAGQIVETGAIQDVFRAPWHPYTRALLQSVPHFGRVQDSLAVIPGSPPNLTALPGGCRFHPRCAFARDDCRHGAFPLRPIDGRSTACIHWDACAAADEEEPIVVDA